MPRNLTIRNKIKVPLALLVLLFGIFTFLRIDNFRQAEAVLHLNMQATEETIRAIALLETVAARVRGFAERFPELSDQDAFDELLADGRGILDAAEASLAPLRISVDLRERIQEGFEHLETDLLRLAAAARNRVTAELAVDAGADRLLNAADIVETTSARLVSGVLLGVSAGAGGAEAIIGAVEPALRLRIEVSDLLSSLEALVAAETVQRRESLLSETQIALDDVAVTAIRVAASDRSRLFEALKTTRTALTSPGGFAERASILREAEHHFAETLQTLRSTAATEFVGLSDLTSVTGEGVRTFLAQQRSTALSAARFEILLTTVIGLGAVLLVWWLFTRGVSARIEALADDVLAIAHGDLDRQPQDKGGDEIGKMAEALETFRQQARELRRSNEDLENFAYVASHDLRSPLWAIRDLAEWTIEDHSEELAVPVRQNLDHILARVQRLSQLLSDLLDYARAGEVSQSRATVDLGEMVSEIDDLVGVDGFEIYFTGQRNITAAAAPIRTVLLNLISNAIKHHDRDTGEVVVNCTMFDGAAVVDVTDDGPGIAPRYQNKVFELFQTLTAKDVDQSSGLGLAMARKLAEQMGGTLTVLSDPENRRGSTFTLIIPVDAKTASEAPGGALMPDGEAA